MALKVYYLDDEPELCEIFADYFTSSIATVTTFTDPAAAIETTHRQPPDVFFTDYRLPGTTGDLVAQKLDASIPKFLISGDPWMSTKTVFLKVFQKPYDVIAINETIQQLAREKSNSK